MTLTCDNCDMILSYTFFYAVSLKVKVKEKKYK